MKRPILAIILAAYCCSWGFAQNDKPTFNITHATKPPEIDGVLNDEAWQEEPLPLGDWVSYSPIRGAMADQKTEVRVTYDDRYLYFGFHCFDTEPEKIRTTITRRDNAFSDDWIAMSLDSEGTGQTAYHLFVNPSGMQMDALNTTASGEQFEADMLWNSAGRIADDGYIVEMRIPLQTLRFSGGPEVRMGILFFRKISRTGVSYSWPAMPPGQWVFENPAHLVFANLHQPLLLEILPSVTYGINQTRGSKDRWNKSVDKADIGFSAKYGITSNITIDATVNPDFSQVESDAFQVQVNQRFPTFFSEKRPFFMEGMGLFNIAGTGNSDGNMRTAVHTRRIVDPSWGTKLIGAAGKTTFGVLNASDDSPEGAPDGDDKFFTIGRATYSLGQSNYLGGILVDTENSGRSNRVAGGDLFLKFASSHQLSTTFLASHTSPEGGASTHAVASQLWYSYDTNRLSLSNQIEHYGRDFQMDTAFINRTGFTAGWSYGELSFYPREGSWVKRIFPFYFLKQGRDQVQDGNERSFNTGVRFNFTRQGFLNISHFRGMEPWKGQRFSTGGYINVNGNVQILPWLNVNAGFNKSKEIYYDPAAPFLGRTTRPNLGFTLQPDPHFSQSVSIDKVNFKRASNNQQVFKVAIVNTRTTYQFNSHFMIRLLEQFDSSSHRLLTDLLASYEVVPGTVFHAGYGSLYEKPSADANGPSPNNLGVDYITVSRGLFFKASYRWRF